MTITKPVQHYRTNVLGREPNPNNMVEGEIAINTADGTLFTKDTSNKLVDLTYKLQILPTGTGTNMSTEQFLDWLTEKGAFNVPQWSCKCAFDFVNNNTITGTGCGDIPLAGSLVEVFTHVHPTILYTIIRVTAVAHVSLLTNGLRNTEFVYTNQGSGYPSGWRRTYTTTQRPTAYDIPVPAPVTKNESTLVKQVYALKNEINYLRANLSAVLTQLNLTPIQVTTLEVPEQVIPDTPTSLEEPQVDTPSTLEEPVKTDIPTPY